MSAGNCQPNDIQWEDEGPNFDESIYEGWMGMNIDNRDWSCLQVCPTIVSNVGVLKIRVHQTLH